ncbi:hypothetical protein AMJ86_00680 [bacterium SM23_57]|nr:MAG: hypothetical protein AMJ86_00680 [bacterium SM23_57]
MFGVGFIVLLFWFKSEQSTTCFVGHVFIHDAVIRPCPDNHPGSISECEVYDPAMASVKEQCDDRENEEQNYKNRINRSSRYNESNQFHFVWVYLFFSNISGKNAYSHPRTTLHFAPLRSMHWNFLSASA